MTVPRGIATFSVDGSEVVCPLPVRNPFHGDLRVGVSTETGQQRGALVEKTGRAGIANAEACFLPASGGGARRASGVEALLRVMESVRTSADGHRVSEPETAVQKLTFNDNYSAVDVHGGCSFQSNNDAAFTLYTNETLDAGQPIVVNAVLLDLKGSNISIGLFPAHNASECQNNRVGSAGLPGSVACRIGGGRARVLSNGTEWSSVACDSNTPVLVQMTVENGIVSFLVDGDAVECPQLAESRLHGEVRVGVSTETGRQRGALVQKAGAPGIADAEACFSSSGSGGFGGGGGGYHAPNPNAPEVGPLYTDAAQLKLDVEEDGPIVALTPTVFRCNEAQDATMYAPVPLSAGETAAIGVSVRFTGIKNGFVGCGFLKKAALDGGEAHQHLVGKTAHSIGCLLKNGEVFVFIDDKPVFCGPTMADADELTMRFASDRTRGMSARIEKGVVHCDEFKDLSLFSGDLYFAVSLSEEGQLARMLPGGLDVQRFHYGMKSMNVDEDKLMSCKHSVRASLSAHERWYGNAEKVFAMRITNVCREPIGLGLVSAKLWNNGKRNIVGNKDFGPHSIGLLIKDRRVYVNYQDELVQWKPVGRMPPIAKNVDLVMRVSGGKVSFFYQGIPVVLPVVSELTLPSDERFRAAYTTSDKGQAAVIPPSVAVRAPDSVARRCSLLGDPVHVELTDHHRSACAMFADALCLSSEAFAITPSPWAAYPQGCSGCECRHDSAVRASGTLWLCAQCGAPEEFALCDTCYWDAALARKHGHARNQFIPLLGTGLYEMHLTVDSAKDSYMEVGVAPAGYEDSFGAFAANASVVLGQVPELVKCSMPAGKLAAGCPALKNGDKVCLRVKGAALSVLVNDEHVFETTLPTDEPFMSQPLRFAVRMGCAGQTIRVLRTSLLPSAVGCAVTVTDDAERVARECDAAKVPAAERAAAGATGTLVALDALRQLVTMDVGGARVQCALACIIECLAPEESSLPSSADSGRTVAAAMRRA